MSDRFEVFTSADDISVIDTWVEDENEREITNGFKREASAKVVCNALNSLQDKVDEKPLDLHKDFTKWDELISRLDKSTRRLVEIDEIYLAESDRILAEARENEVDFKAIYGGNNATTRKQYVDEQLTDLLEEKKELEFQKADDNRRISFLKKHIDMKIQLIQYD